ncbi:class I SAM-dependent methyltransferase [Robertmurraya sp. Marseille-Q9965]
MFVTTAGRTNEEMIKMAKEVALEIKAQYITRNKRSVRALQEIHKEDCIVVGKERLELFPLGENEPFFFHPNSSMFRIKRLMDNGHDPFIEACDLERGKHILDCTLGLASDSIVASYIVGNEGRVVGVEGNPYLAYLVEKGLQSWKSRIEEMNNALSHIEVVQQLSLEYLKTLPDKSFDCVYFDPMFEERILESDGIKGLSQIAVYHDITNEMITHAKRVARERVVLKDHFRSQRFEKYNFEVLRRKTAKFHFGVLQIQ